MGARLVASTGEARRGRKWKVMLWKVRRSRNTYLR